MKWLINKPKAFNIAYFILFTIAWGALFVEAYLSFKCPAVDALTQGTKQNNMSGTYFALAFPAIGLGAHIFRIYNTLHDLDERGALYEDLITGLANWQKKVEFGIRIVLVMVISLKIVSFFPFLRVVDTHTFGRFVLIMYSVLVVWDIVLWWFRSKIGSAWPYFLTDIMGFLFGLAVFLLTPDPITEAHNYSWILNTMMLFGTLIVVSMAIPFIIKKLKMVTN